MRLEERLGQKISAARMTHASSGLTFAVIWLFYVPYADPTRGSVNVAVGRTYLSPSRST